MYNAELNLGQGKKNYYSLYYWDNDQNLNMDYRCITNTLI